MKGKITISTEEVRRMVHDWVTHNALTPSGFRITDVKNLYGTYSPTLEIDFTNEPDAGEGLPEGGE